MKYWRPLSRKQNSWEAINHLAFSKHQGMKIPVTEEQEEATFITAKACAWGLESYCHTRGGREAYKAVWAPRYWLV